MRTIEREAPYIPYSGSVLEKATGVQGFREAIREAGNPIGAFGLSIIVFPTEFLFPTSSRFQVYGTIDQVSVRDIVSGTSGRLAGTSLVAFVADIAAIAVAWNIGEAGIPSFLAAKLITNLAIHSGWNGIRAMLEKIKGAPLAIRM